MLESTARLFIKKALDESGQPQYQADALPVLMRVFVDANRSQADGCHE